jgi:hypothetical protein
MKADAVRERPQWCQARREFGPQQLADRRALAGGIAP